MNRLRIMGLMLVIVLLAALSAAGAGATGTAPATGGASALPASPWWLVTHNQCEDTLHWINPTGQFAVIPRPVMPNEAPGVACVYREMHISQDGRYLVQVGALTSGRAGLGFYDLQDARWIAVQEAQPNEFVYLGERYSSDAANRIAVGFANAETAPRGWRVVIFDMTTAAPIQELRSDGPEIAAFVGAEFLATALTVPRVLLLAHNDTSGTDAIHIRFDGFEWGDEPLGAAAWYPDGAPGVTQKLISSPYRATDIDLLPNGHAIYAYEDSNYPVVAPVGGPLPQTNAIAMLLPADFDPSPTSQFFFADGISSLYGAHWGADGDMALFWRASEGTSYLHWITMGTTVLIPINQQVSQVIGVPDGFVYNTGSGIYSLSSASASPVGPAFSSLASGTMEFVWASTFGNPPLALDTLPIATPVPPGPGIVIATPVPTGPGFATATPVPATPDTGACRLRSADGSNINVRTGPGTNYPVLGQLLGGSEAAVTGYNGQWYTINFMGSQGWAANWVVTTLGNCAALSFVAAPPTPVPAGPIIEFWADRTSLAAGECTNVNWRVENIREVYYEGAGVVGTGSRNECPTTTTTYTLTITLTDGSTQTRTVTITVGGGGGAQPDLYVSEFSLDPGTPTKGQPVNVRVGVYNQGNAAAVGSFHIEWYPGENYPAPACAWDLDSMAAHGGRILTCTYAGYPSPYGSIATMVKVDTYGGIAESNEGNNIYTQPVTVNDSGGGGGGQPDLYVSEFSLSPGTPVKGQPVNVRVGVYNQGNAASTGFRVEWYPGENYPTPACTWDVDSMAAHGGRILTCTYAGYPSPYGSINTMVKVDSNNTVSESNEGNNIYKTPVTVTNP